MGSERGKGRGERKERERKERERERERERKKERKREMCLLNSITKVCSNKWLKLAKTCLIVISNKSISSCTCKHLIVTDCENPKKHILIWSYLLNVFESQVPNKKAD